MTTSKTVIIPAKGGLVTKKAVVESLFLGSKFAYLNAIKLSMELLEDEADVEWLQRYWLKNSIPVRLLRKVCEAIEIKVQIQIE